MLPNTTGEVMWSCNATANVVPFMYVVLVPDFGNNQQYQPRHLYVSAEATPYTMLQSSTKHGCTGCGFPIFFRLLCMICRIQPHPMPAE